MTFTGSTLTLQNAARVRGTGTLFNGGSSGETFTIQGETSNSGSLGTNELGIVNRSGGLINANVAGLFLLVDPNATSGLTNTGIMQASAGGLLRLTGNGGGDFNNSGGLIQALDGSEVQFTGGATINGGTLTTLGSGVIRNLGTATLNDVTNSGAFIANNASVTTLGGTINSTGSILVNSTGSFTDLTINGSVTLTGGSTLTLQNAARVRGTGTLFNGGSSGEAFTIQGETSNSGSIGTNELAIVNRSGGLIDANVFNGTVGLALVVDPRTIDGLINLGVMRASGGGILLFTGNGGGAFTNTGGTISALTGSEVQLTTGASITGGTLSTVGTGVLRNLNTATLTSLTNAGTFIGNNASVTTLNGTILNSGSFSINSTGSFTDLLLGSDVTLSGGGTVSLVNADRVRGGGILTNIDNTIQGETSNSGSLGNNEIGLVNQAGGVISANISGLTLNVDPNSTNGLVNQGTMQAINGGILRLNGNGGGTFTNNGTIKALSGGMLKFEGTVTSSGTVDVGSDTLSISGSGSYAQTAGTFRLAGGTVTSSTALNFNGGLIDARGSINSAITNGGNLQPALGGTGLSVTGAVTLLSTSKLTFQLGGLTQGNQYGFLNANGSVALNGNLVVSFVNSFKAGNEDNFTVLSATALSGSFTNVASGTRLATTDSSGTFLVTYDGTTVTLSNFQPIGEAPSSPDATESAEHVAGPRSAGRGPYRKTKIDAESPAAPGTSSVAVKNAPARARPPRQPKQMCRLLAPRAGKLPARREGAGRSRSLWKILISSLACSKDPGPPRRRAK